MPTPTRPSHFALRLIASLVLLAVAAPAQAAFLAVYDFTGAPGNQAASSTATGITSTPLFTGPGLRLRPAANSLNSEQWTNASSPSSGDSVGFEVNTQSGVTASLDSLSYSEQRSSTGPTSFMLTIALYSRDESQGSVHIVGFVRYEYTLTTTDTVRRVIDLSTVSLFQNFSGIVRVNLNGYNASSPVGTYRLGIDAANNPNGYVPDLILEGEVHGANPVPAPPGVILAGVGVACVGLARLRRRPPAVA
jgi:hypothetical protein